MSLLFYPSFLLDLHSVLLLTKNQVMHIAGFMATSILYPPKLNKIQQINLRDYPKSWQKFAGNSSIIITRTKLTLHSKEGVHMLHLPMKFCFNWTLTNLIQRS